MTNSTVHVSALEFLVVIGSSGIFGEKLVSNQVKTILGFYVVQSTTSMQSMLLLGGLGACPPVENCVLSD